MTKITARNEMDELVARYQMEKPKNYAETKPYAEAIHRLHHESIDRKEMYEIIEALYQHDDPRYVRVEDRYGVKWAFAMLNGKLHKDYLVSDTGIVFTNKKRGGVVLAQSVTTYGYLTVSLCTDGEIKLTQVHRLVVESHLGANFKTQKKLTSNSLTVDHTYNCRIDNRLMNLTVMSHAENVSKGRSKGVTLQCIATGELMSAKSMSAMATIIGSDTSNISRLVSGFRKTVRGYQLPTTH
ncbi:hypothetical protein [Vibrio breoganii]|uniref:hypothetical protein n=1 Tax=Vibrio breoganii TaxID=553239 RepID=UPI000C8628DC|nr:hypothetical protein [Vibrio breoganii]PMM26369.1 hypothetical protein BCT59_02690 [Vibrio breoganii]